jgi:acyl carrier protein
MTMTISSRTPEGVPNHCPVCRSDICLEPSPPAGDAPCPNCGTLLWFTTTPRGRMYCDSTAMAQARQRLLELLRAHLGVETDLDTSASFKDIGADSLDVVKLVMELEEEFGFTIPDDEAKRFKTIEDVLNYFAMHQAPTA